MLRKTVCCRGNFVFGRLTIELFSIHRFMLACLVVLYGRQSSPNAALITQIPDPEEYLIMSAPHASKKRKVSAINGEVSYGASQADLLQAAASSSSTAQVLSEQQSSAASRLLKFTGHMHFRQRLILSILSGRPIRIDKIRSQNTEPGITTCEASFLRLLEKVTNGSKVEIGYTGTSIFFKPGVVAGGKVSHDCGLDKSIGWFLEWIVVLAPFAKRELHLTMKGITTSHDELGVHIFFSFFSISTH